MHYTYSPLQIATSLLGTALFCLIAPTTATAGLVTITTSDSPVVSGMRNQGWYTSSGGHTYGNENYIAGWGDTYRDFFSFDLSTIDLVPGETIVGATLELTRFSQTATQVYSLYDVSTDAATLLNSSNNVGIYNDLGTGISYGMYTVPFGSNSGDILSFALNANALAAISSTVASNGYFSVGGRSDAGPADYIFGSSGGSGAIERLVITTSILPSVPEPTTALFGMALFGFCAASRRRAAAMS